MKILFPQNRLIVRNFVGSHVRVGSDSRSFMLAIDHGYMYINPVHVWKGCVLCNLQQRILVPGQIWPSCASARPIRANRLLSIAGTRKTWHWSQQKSLRALWKQLTCYVRQRMPKGFCPLSSAQRRVEDAQVPLRNFAMIWDCREPSAQNLDCRVSDGIQGRSPFLDHDKFEDSAARFRHYRKHHA